MNCAEAKNEQRYAIGTVNQWDIFQPDTIGNDPELTTFDQLFEAVWEIQECIAASAAYEPITNAAVYDNHLDRIVWSQEKN